MDAVFDCDQGKINKWIKNRWGLSINGLPLYRLVWAPVQYEERWGDFNDYLPGTKILLRRVREVREVKKYPGVGPRWILEKMTPVGYEIFYTFEADDEHERIPLPVTYPALEMILHFATTGKIKHDVFKDEEEDKKKDEAEVRAFEQQIDNPAPLLSNAGGISMRGKNSRHD